ncbi:MAG: CopG family transcriptional regulator [Dehalococcoidia bacterium]|jgi:predicted transcriptional regulator
MVKFTVTISLEMDAYMAIGELAERMRMSKSQVLEMAAKEFIQNHKVKKSTESPEAEYEDLSDIEIESVETRSHSVGSKLLGS